MILFLQLGHNSESATTIFDSLEILLYFPHQQTLLVLLLMPVVVLKYHLWMHSVFSWIDTALFSSPANSLSPASNAGGCSKVPSFDALCIFPDLGSGVRT